MAYVADKSQRHLLENKRKNAFEKHVLHFKAGQFGKNFFGNSRRQTVFEFGELLALLFGQGILVIIEDTHGADQLFLKLEVGRDGQVIDWRLQQQGFFHALLRGLVIFHIEIFIRHHIGLGNVALKKKLATCLEIDPSQQRKQQKRGYEQKNCPATAVMAPQKLIETIKSRLSIVCFRQCHRR